MEPCGELPTAFHFLYNSPKYNNVEYFKTASLYLRNKYFEVKPNLLPK